jgi:thiaminase (transcriptional activator TenA)
MAIAAPLGLFDDLRARVGPLWDQAQDHPFVRELAAGTLPRESFIHYLRQDYVYCVAFCRAASLAAAKVRSVEEMQLFAGMVDAVLNHELQVHREYCAEYGITPEQLEAEQAAPGCRAYLDFCVATASLDDSTALLCALVPCAVGYAEIGARLAQQNADVADHPYRRWIEMYSGAEYQAFAKWIREQLDQMGAGVHTARREELAKLFTLGCRYEWLFWEMAHTRQQWPL